MSDSCRDNTPRTDRAIARHFGNQKVIATTRRGPKASREWMYEGRYAWKPTSKYQEMI